MDKQSTINEVWGSSVDRFSDVGFDNLTPGEQTAICLTNIYADVQNGGFETYYLNSAGDYAIETPRLLDRIGAPELADIVRRCNSVLGPSGPPREREKRISIVDSLDESQCSELDKLTEKFYDLDYDAQERFEQFALQHLDEFPGIGCS